MGRKAIARRAGIHITKPPCLVFYDSFAVCVVYEDRRIACEHMVGVEAVDGEVVGGAGCGVGGGVEDLGEAAGGVLECVAGFEVGGLGPGRSIYRTSTDAPDDISAAHQPS
jgi:hypothetical protein